MAIRPAAIGCRRLRTTGQIRNPKVKNIDEWRFMFIFFRLAAAVFLGSSFQDYTSNQA
jgi:hypothetical protein